MKKSLLIMVAAVMVALGANAQLKRSVQATKVNAPSAVNFSVEKAPALNITDMAVAHRSGKQVARRAASDIAGSYILDYYNFAGDFCTSSSFTIEAASGTINAHNLETDEDNIEFTYNVCLRDFTWKGGVAYAYYDEEAGFIHIPTQSIGRNATYGRIILSAITSVNGEPMHVGLDINLQIDEDGTISIYDAEEELKEAGYAEGEIITGWYSFLPDYEDGNSAWNFGVDIELFRTNAYMTGYEVHIENGNWGAWTRTEHDICVEDYGTELVVHNFFDLCPISITIEGDKASIATPVQVEDYNYASDGEEPNYIQIWQWDENFENIVNPGAITGNVGKTKDGSKVIEFYDTEYKEAWTDEQGDHEAGNYIITDYTKWFMVHSTWGDNGAYWWGEARNVYLVMADETQGIAAPSVTSENQSTKLYDLQGRAVDSNYKGIVIKNGKKVVVK
jgi:hypothetical protein